MVIKHYLWGSLLFICGMVAMLSCSKESIGEDSNCKYEIEQSSLGELASMMSSISIDGQICDEVLSAVNESIKYGQDECLRFREIFMDETKTKINSSAPALLRQRIEEYLKTHSTTKSDVINCLADSEVQIYWPYSEDWDGKTIPVITFAPEDKEQTWNWGYRRSLLSDGTIQIDTVYVDEDFAVNNPVWIINESKENYEDLPFFTKGEDTAKGITFISSYNSSSRTKSSIGHEWVLREAKVTKQYDNLFDGASNFRLTIIVPGVTVGNNIVSFRALRKQIRKKQWFDVNRTLNDNWPENLDINYMNIVETNGGSTQTMTIPFDFIDPVTNEHRVVNQTFTYESKDTFVHGWQYHRSLIESRGRNYQWVTSDGYTYLKMEII